MLCLQLKLKEKISDVNCINIKARDLASFTAVSMSEDNSVIYLMMKFKKIRDKYKVKVTFDGKKETPAFKNILSSGKLTVFISSKGNLSWVVYDGKKIGSDEFLQSFITYGGRKYYPGSNIFGTQITEDFATFILKVFSIIVIFFF